MKLITAVEKLSGTERWVVRLSVGNVRFHSVTCYATLGEATDCANRLDVALKQKETTP